MFRNSKTNRRSGLSLIEVMIAMAILATGLFALIATASRCMSVARKAKNYEKARHLMALVDKEDPLPLREEIEDGVESGSFDGHYGYSWTREIKKVSELAADDKDDDGLYEVVTRVFWSDSGKKAFEEVVTYIHAPKVRKGGSFSGSP